jgi:hypothetical protein
MTIIRCTCMGHAERLLEERGIGWEIDHDREGWFIKKVS